LRPHTTHWGSCESEPDSRLLTAPHSHYPTGDEGWIAVACTNDKIYARLCNALGRPELAGDPRFRTVRDRVTNREAIDSIVGEFTNSRPTAELVELLDPFEVPVSPIYSIAEVATDPQYQARDTLIGIVDEYVGRVRTPNVVPRLSRSPGSVRHLGRKLGADNELVYREWLGLSVEEIAELREAGTIY
jgi:crotonobetainyl-CoA:carnitine CoA-transferase CaiB-like acyl-CoA transferase